MGLKAWRQDGTWKPVTEELIKEALEILLDINYHPVLVLCAYVRNTSNKPLKSNYSSGIHQTGTLVGCLRRLQDWSLTSILVEVTILHKTLC